MDYGTEFEAFWAVYPNKVAKGGAVKSYAKARQRADAETILAGAKRYAAQSRGKDAQYIAHPSTWLNQERWSDQAKPEPKFPGYVPMHPGAGG